MIYFVQDPTTHEIKIGFTDGEADHRRKQFQTGNPRELIVLLTMDGDKAKEGELHARFKTARGLGEWFRPIPELLQYILEIRADLECCKASERLSKEDERSQGMLADAGWPPYLRKAALDPFVYACGLKNGTSFTFEHATEIGHGWVRLGGVKGHTLGRLPCDDFEGQPRFPSFDRGVDVRVSEIVWVADAPFGS